MDPRTILDEGARLLAPKLVPFGFSFIPGAYGKGSGGDAASGHFVRGDRKLELHFRYSLGLVTYHFGVMEMSHADFMRSVLGSKGGNKYPGFSDDPLQGFMDLAYDLEHYAKDFIEGADDELRGHFVQSGRSPAPRGFKAINDGDAV